MLEMKPLKKIQLELYPDKADEFYLSLLKYKLSEKPDLKTLQSLADAIHFDKDSWKSWEQTDERKKKINDKLHDIHIFLLNSKKYSKQYFTVSKENFEEFQKSPFLIPLWFQLPNASYSLIMKKVIYSVSS